MPSKNVHPCEFDKAGRPLALLTDSYISSFLLDTLENIGVPTFATQALLATIPQHLEAISEARAKELLSKKCNKVYFNAEDSLPFIERHAKNQERLKAIRFFKDKHAFKANFADSDAEAFFTLVKKDELANFKPPENRKLIIKPAIGFHSLGIRSFTGLEAYRQAVSEILPEIEAHQQTFDKGVVSDAAFLVEDYIEGEEIAADAFFDSKGEPHILGIYIHPFLNEQDTRDLVYYTHRLVMQKWLSPVERFLGRIGSNMPLVNFPLHFEMRAKAGKIFPIEVNPLRLGGFGLADLPYYAFGLNSYEAFFTDTPPNWDDLFETSDDAYYAFVVAQTPSSFDTQTMTINHQAFKNTFETLLNYQPLDASRYRFFATAFAKNRQLEELTKYLAMDFDAFGKA